MNDFTNEFRDEVKEEVYRQCEIIAQTLEDKIAYRISNYKPHAIYDKGDFLNNLKHLVTADGDIITIEVGSSAPHATYVTSGSQYSFKKPVLPPLLAWVKRKRLSWVDKSGKALTALQMAFMIRNKIYRDGIKERNVFDEVLREELDWIKKKLGV
jgi:hypothetical protein